MIVLWVNILHCVWEFHKIKFPKSSMFPLELSQTGSDLGELPYLDGFWWMNSSTVIRWLRLSVKQIDSFCSSFLTNPVSQWVHLSGGEISACLSINATLKKEWNIDKEKTFVFFQLPKSDTLSHLIFNFWILKNVNMCQKILFSSSVSIVFQKIGFAVFN